MSNEKCDEKLESIIKELCKEQVLNDIAKEIISSLESIYKGDSGQKYRHKYSKITDIILNTSQKREETLMIISQNLRVLEEKIKNKDEDEFKIQFAKLYDHINLECIRLRDVDNKINEVKNATKKSKQELQEIQKKYEILENSLNKQQNQYITILGIFASIVLAFVGGLVFSNSALSNIDKVSIFRLVFVIAFIALFFGNILYQLFSFLLKITSRAKKKESRYKKSIFLFNIIVVFFMLVGLIAEIY